jgi:phosphatidylserine/phosphatidylglycerophosphate/cardiolipin synthase-like enzyme
VVLGACSTSARSASPPPTTTGVTTLGGVPPPAVVTNPPGTPTAPPAHATTAPPGRTTTAAPTATTAAPPTPGGAPGTAPPTLITEPTAGIAPIDGLLRSPRHTLDLTMYELVDTTAEQILAADAASGVRVRVILDGDEERSSNEAAYAYLSGHGVEVAWSSPAYEATHEKAMVIDGAIAVIMTLNLTSRYYAQDRDVAIVDRDPVDVAAVEQVFAADLTGAAVTPSGGDDLVWSPGSEPALEELIAGARSSLLVENEEMSAPGIIAALATAARRGVDVRVVMTADSEWDGAFDQLSGAGVQVSTYDEDAPLYIHAKVVVADGARAFVGSENFSDASLDRNRELGLITSDPTVVGSLASTIAADAGGGRPWAAPG